MDKDLSNWLDDEGVTQWEISKYFAERCVEVSPVPENHVGTLYAAARIQQLEARNAELEALLAHAQKEANDATDIMQETSLEAGDKLATIEAAIALLDKEYESGRNPDPEDHRSCAIYQVSGGRNDREWKLVSVGTTTLEALLALTAGEVDCKS